MLVGPLVLLIYEPLIGTVRWRDSAGFLVRIGVLGTLASLWWIVPLVVHAELRHRLPPVHRAAALDLGHQQRARGAAPDGVLDLVHRRRASTASNRPLFSEAGTLLFNPLVVGASLLLPALAIGRLRLDAALALRARSCCWCCWSGW